MSNDALKRASRKARKPYADGGLSTDVPYTSDDPQMEAMANAQKPVTEAVGQQIADDYANRLTYEDAVAAAKGDAEAQAKVHEKSLGTAMGSLGPKEPLKIRGVSIKDMTLSKLELQALKAPPSSPIQKDIQAEIKIRQERGEKSWRPPTTLPKELTLEHYSHVPNLKTIDPTKMGTGFDARVRGRSTEHPHSFFYEAGTAPEAHTAVGQAPHRYLAKVKAEHIYDIGADPEGLAAKAIEDNQGIFNMDRVHEAIKGAGYKGWRNTASEIPNAVASYEALPATRGLPKRFSIMTAENPSAKSLSPEENSKRMRSLLKDLKEMGAKFETVEGQYGGNKENSVLIEHTEGLDPKALESLAKKYGQESIIHHDSGGNELKYLSGTPSVKGSGIEYPQDTMGDHSIVRGVPFKLGLKFAEGGEVSQPQIGYNQIQSATVDPNTINYGQPPQSDIPSGPQGNVNVLSPENELVSVDPSQLHEALNAGYKIPTPEEEKHHLNEAEFGTAGQQAATALEGAAEALTFGTSTGLERGLGISTPERITARRETNPGMHTLGQVGGLAASALIPVAGEANIMRAGGMGLARAAGLTGSSVIHQVGNAAVRGAFDMAVLQGGEEVSKAFASDPHQSAESALAHIGMATVMGGVFGGVAGAALNAASRVGQKVISEIDRPAMEAGTFESAVNGSGLFKESEKKGILEALRTPKKDAPEIIAASERLGAPVMEGMVSDNHLVQKAEDALINGAPTYSGLRRQQMYKDGLDRATGAVDAALGEGSNHSKAELGNLIKSGLTFSLEEQNAPIKAMYDTLKAEHSIIPLAENAGESIVKGMQGIEAMRIAPSSPEGMLAKRTMREIQALKTVDDIKNYKTILRQGLSSTASPGEKRVASIIGDELTKIEENSIEAFARKQGRPELMNLISARKAANSNYAEFIKKVQTLSEQLGKGRVYGVQDAIHFIQERLTPEEVTSRLFAKNNSEFLKFFSKEFPEQMNLMRDYQKGVLREEASRTGALSPKILFNKVNKLEPEIQEALFSKEELAKLKDAETYIRAIPKNFNPSGTAHMSAMRGFFEHPLGATVANARDYGIEKFIKLVGTTPEVRQAMELGNAIVKSEKASKRAINNIFQAADDVALPRTADAKESDKAKIDKMVTQYTTHPEKMMDIGANNPIPEMSEAFAASAARAVQHLSSMRPDLSPKAPLDSKLPMNSAQKSDYDRALTVAANPMTVLDRIRNNTVTIKDVTTLNAIYPNLYRKFSADIQNKIAEKVEKGESIPYSTRMSLSTFLGQPLDSTMSPIGILGAQVPSGSQQTPQQAAGGQGAGPKKSTSSLSKLPQSYQTSEQTRESRRQKP